MEQPRSTVVVFATVVMLVLSLGALGVVGATGGTDETADTSAEEIDEPKLVIDRFDMPRTAEPGEEITVEFEITNVGGAAVERPIEFDTEWGASEEVQVQLEPGESVTLTEEMPVPEEQSPFHVLGYTGDMFWVSWITVTDDPDEVPLVTLADMELPATAQAGEEIEVEFTLENLGTEPRAASLEYMSDTVQEQGELEIDPGETETVSLDVPVPTHADQFEQAVQVFTQGAEAPSDIVEIMTAVTGAADLDVTIEDVSLPQIIEEGESEVVEATVQNDGDEEVQVPVEYVFEDDVIDRTDLTLEPGESETVELEMPPGLPAGEWEHGIVVGGEAAIEPLSVLSPELSAYVEELEGQLADKDDQIDDLEDQLDEKDDQIDDLEEELEERQAEIESLDDTIDSLEAELETAEVSIDVTVEPADAATFEVGGDAIVSVSGENFEPDDVTIEAGGQGYVPTDGQATIPLDQEGEVDVALTYEDETEEFTLLVDDTDAPADDEDDTDTVDETDDTDVDDTDDADDALPGFGLVVGLIGVILGGLGLRATLRR